MNTGTGMRVAMWLAIGLATASCTGGAGEDATPTPTATAPTATTVPPPDLDDAVRVTAAQPTLRFRLVTESSMAGASTGSMTRAGAFDAVAERGFGSFARTLVDNGFAGLEDTALSSGVSSEPAGGRRLEFRRVDGTFWQHVARPAGRRWTGTDADGLTAVPGNSLAGAAAGGLIAQALGDAVVRVNGATDAPNGARVWTVELDGHQIGGLLTDSSLYAGLPVAEFDEQNGVPVDARVTVDADGRIVRVESDLSDWWRAARSRGTGKPVGKLAVRAVLTLDGFGETVAVTPPCPDPTTDLSEREVLLVCPG